MPGLFPLRFRRNTVATCVILFTTAMFMRDKAAVLRLRREQRLQGSSIHMTHITPHPYDVTPVKPEVGTTAQFKEKAVTVNFSKSDSSIGHVIGAMGNVKAKNPDRVNLYKKYYVSRKQKVEQSLQLFNTSITLDDKFVFKELIKAFTKIANENELEYFLCCGSLLGSYRHHGMIPWDDDMDVMMNSSHKKAIKSAFQFPSIITLESSRSSRWKVYFNSSNPIKGYPWKWPFLDFIFFKENSTHIWDMDPNFPKACFRKLSIYPTVSRPFWDFWLPAPRDTERVLKKEFNVDMCVTSMWNHTVEKSRRESPYRRVPCKLLSGRVPLVQRQILNDSHIIETLYIGNKTRNAVLIKKP